jgi:iron complex outermembrane receptor protein
MKHHKHNLAVLLASACALPSVAHAQQAAAPAPQAVTNPQAPSAANGAGPILGDIIVTARKRAETSLQVPVVLTGVSSSEIQRRAIVNVEGIARVVPQLLVAPDTGVQGGTIAIRGISGPAANSFGDQAVAFNIDGVQVAKSSVRRMSQMDIDQIEVLKGPQALFYGKNSPGGIITIRSADPTQHFEAQGSLGYEFYAHEIRGEGYVSGPITDTLGIRVAGYYSHMDGDVDNEIPDGAYLKNSSDSHQPNGTDYAGRITLKWEPSDRFNLRFKTTYNKTENSGPTGQLQKIGCVNGTPQSGGIDDCKADGYAANGSPGPLTVGLPGYFRDGQNYADQWQVLSSLEMNYKINDNLTLSSVTGLYAFAVDLAGDYSADYALDLASSSRLTDRELSQEFRIQSSYEGPLNFTAGLFGSDTRQDAFSTALLYAAEPSAIPLVAALGFPAKLQSLNSLSAARLIQDGRAYSAYAQISFKPVEKIEITAGGRYSHEEKDLPLVRTGSALQPLDASTEVTPLFTRKTFHDFSPEVTIAYRPTSRLNFFASYKHGFLSGGFNGTATNFRGDISYNPETVKGFEAGAKASLFGDMLRLNAAAYTYKVSGLQVTNFINAVAFLRNAAAVRIKGLEGDFNWRTPLQGFSIHGAGAYNDGRYTSFPNASCFKGQTPAQGCFFNATTGAPGQDLSGKPLIQTPKFAGNLGIAYEHPLSDALKMGLSVDSSYSSSYFADAFEDPRGKEPAYALVDATLRVAETHDKWELALIGRNLTNRYYWGTALDISFTGSGTATPNGVRADKYAGVSRGREVMLRYTMKFGR